MKILLCLMTSLVTSAAWASEVVIEMSPITRAVQPGLAAVVQVTAVNQGTEKVAEVADLYADPYGAGWSWSWSWNDDKQTQSIRDRDLLDAIPDPVYAPPIKLQPGESCAWFVVVPVPTEIAGDDSASLWIGYPLSTKENAQSSCSFKIDQRLAIPPRGIAANWFKKMLPTGTEVNASGWLQSQKSDLKRWSTETDPSLLLGWFCINLTRNGFEERAWSRLQTGPKELRDIRNARLECALRCGLLLSAENVRTIVRDVKKGDPLSDSLRKQVERKQ